MRQQIFRPLEPFGQFLADGLFDHPLPGEPDQRAGFGQLDVAEHRVARRHTARRRVGQHDDVRQSGLAQGRQRDGSARHLHQAQYPFLHPRAARGGEQDIGQSRVDRGLDPGDDRGADGDAHRSAHEGEILYPDDRVMAAD